MENMSVNFDQNVTATLPVWVTSQMGMKFTGCCWPKTTTNARAASVPTPVGPLSTLTHV